ncbi:unnamed protein product [marine sediment metagenome]|uniref:Uncharacterized protein n=1 Tax=marine sediment metagenome TaxID=412755 RepID=X1CV72_9ZZZZ
MRYSIINTELYHFWVDQMEDRELVSAYDGNKPREVLISKVDLIKLLDEKEN